jgi:hypothetical protein
MNGDQSTNEILRAVGSLEGTVKVLVESFNDVKSDLKNVGTTCTKFEEYQAARKDLPDRLSRVESIAEDYQKSKIARDEKYKQIEFLIERWKLLLMLAAVINGLAILLGFMFTRGWLKWDL